MVTRQHSWCSLQRDICKHTYLDHVLVLFAVEGALILQPAPVAGHTADLLTIVIRYRIVHGGRSRVCTVTLDVSVKSLFFLSRCQLPVHVVRVSPMPGGMTWQIAVAETVRERNPLTLANSGATELFHTLKKAVPKNGPMSQPTPPTAINDPPMTNMGSSPVICAPMFSISYSAIRGVAIAMLPIPAKMDATRFT